MIKYLRCHKYFLLLTIFILSVSLLLYGCGGRSVVEQEEEELTEEEKEEEHTVVTLKEDTEDNETSPLIVKIGDEAINEQVTIVVHSVNFYDQITSNMGSTYKPSKAGEVFVIVDMTINNVSGDILNISPTYVQLVDNVNDQCSRTTVIIIGRPYELNTLSSEEIPTGDERGGMVVFTAKPGTILSRVSYTKTEPIINIDLEELEVTIPEYVMPRIGEVARGGGIEMRVDSVSTLEELKEDYGEDSEYFKLIWTETAREGYQLLIVDLSIRNILIEPNLTVNPLYVLLIDTESNAYDKVMITLALEGQLKLTDLSPGEEVFGRLLFHVPIGADIDRVLYKIGTLGPAVQVSLE